MSFPTSVSNMVASAVEGDFCDSNPRHSVNAGPGGLVVGSGGAVIGRWHWATAPNDADGTPATITNSGTGAPTGFLHREQQGLNTTYLSESGMAIPPGFGATLMKTGGYWVRNRGSAAVTSATSKVFAVNADGGSVFGAAGATITGATETKWFAQSVGAVGELIKISATPNG